VPSVIEKSTSVPPLNTKLPPPLVSKFSGTSISVPLPKIVLVLSISICAAAGPICTLLLVVSTLKNGVKLPTVASAWNSFASIPLEAPISPN